MAFGKNVKLTVIIPAYNEESKIGQDIKEAFLFFEKSKIKGEVIVSTSATTDKTEQIVLHLQKKYKKLVLISNKRNTGKGGAIKKAVNISNGDLIMFSDAGSCIPFRYIKKGLDTINNNFDIAIGSRRFPGSKVIREQSLQRKIGARIFKSLLGLLGVPKEIEDTQCGFKLYKADSARILFSGLKTRGMMFDIELILRAKKLGFKTGQFPVEWKNDPDSRFKVFSGSLDIIRELYNIKFKYKL